MERHKKTPRPLVAVVDYVGGSEKVDGYYRWAHYRLACGHVGSKPSNARSGGYAPAKMRCDECTSVICHAHVFFLVRAGMYVDARNRLTSDVNDARVYTRSRDAERAAARLNARSL